MVAALLWDLPSCKGLSTSSIQQLPTYVYDKAAPQQSSSADCQLDGEDVCAVCRCDFATGDEVISLPQCNHIFHADCISRWLKRSATCPLCRASI